MIALINVDITDLFYIQYIRYAKIPFRNVLGFHRT